MGQAEEVTFDGPEEDVEEVVQPEQDEPEQEDEPEEEGEQGETKHKVEFSDEQQRFINEEIIAKKVARQREAERQYEQERIRREEVEAELNRLKAPVRPVVPPVPDYFDSEYEAKLAARDEALKRAAAYDARQEAIREADQRAMAEEQQKAAAVTYGRVREYSSRADQLGIKADDLQRAGNYVAQYELPNSLVDEILDDDHGPAITVYLARNPEEIDKIRSMRPTKAWAYIEREIKEKAGAATPRPTKVPTPLENPKGAGFARARGPKGAVFE